MAKKKPTMYELSEQILLLILTSYGLALHATFLNLLHIKLAVVLD